MILKKFFLILLALTYIGLAIYLYIHPMLETKFNYALLILFLVYGSWRLYRAIRQRVDEY